MAHVLIVDDQEDDRVIYGTLIQSMGHHVLLAATAGEAIFLAGAEKPDVVLMDVMLGQLSGLTAAEVLKSQHATSEIPIIIISAYDIRIEEAVAAGGLLLLQKPVTPAQLREALDRALRPRTQRDGP